MRYRHVCVEAFGCTLPPHVVTSDEIEDRLAPVYERLGLPAGRLELMTGIRERRFFDRSVRPGQVSAETAVRTIEASGIDRRHLGALVHGSVCRDQLEPATASGVHHAASLPGSALVIDVSNACLGLLNGMLIVADLIELGRIRAGVVVGTEDGRGLVEGTIDSLLRACGEKGTGSVAPRLTDALDASATVPVPFSPQAEDPAAHRPTLTRKDVKLAFASLTIGSGSAAVVLCDRRLSRTDNRLLGGAFRADTSGHQLCAGGVESDRHGDDRPRMQTDSEALLHAGVALAETTWADTKTTLGWTNADVDKVFTHQVGRAHRKLLFERLQLDPARDFPTVEFLGNTGAVALPVSVALGVQQDHVAAGDRIALLGIGSGLNALMLGIEWHGAPG